MITIISFYIFILLTGGIICAIALPIIFACNNKQVKRKAKTEIYNSYSKYYIAKRYLNTKTETRFYNELIKMTSKLNLLVSTQVSLYNIVQVKNIQEKQKYFNKISRKSIDYVITKKNTNEIICCIELDDYTHKYQNRIERDNFINKLFEDTGVKLYRINVSNSYNLEILENKLRERILKMELHNS